MERDRRPYAAAALLSFWMIASVWQTAEANVFTGSTFRKVQQNCVQFLGINELRLSQYSKFVYPPDRDTMCLVRCIGISLNFWDDVLGFNVSFVEDQFRPLVDANFKKLLTESIDNKLELLDPLDSCSRAYYAFRTFRAQLRQLLSTGTSTVTPPANFEPLTAVQIMNAIIDCASELKLPSVYLTSLSKGMIVDCPEVRCVIRCAAVRTGAYTDQAGALLENLHRQLNPPGEDLTSFTTRQKLCLQRHQQPPCADQCTRAFRQYFTCLRPDYERFFIKNIESVLKLPLFQTEQTVAPSAMASPTTGDALANMDLMDPLLISY